jgi:hypothetical protein
MLASIGRGFTRGLVPMTGFGPFPVNHGIYRGNEFGITAGQNCGVY